MNTVAFPGMKHGIIARQIFVFECIHGVNMGLQLDRLLYSTVFTA